MTEQKDKLSLEQMRRYARELTEEAKKIKLTEDFAFIDQHNLRIKRATSRELNLLLGKKGNTQLHMKGYRVQTWRQCIFVKLKKSPRC